MRGGNKSGSATSIDAVCPPVPSLFAVVGVRQTRRQDDSAKHYYYNDTETTAKGEFRRLWRRSTQLPQRSLDIIEGDYLPVSCVIVCMSFLAARQNEATLSQ